MTLLQPDVEKILTAKLNNENFTLKSFKLETLQADGMMGEHFRLHCETAEKTHKFFVKKKSQVEAYGELPEQVLEKERATFKMFEAFNQPLVNAAVPKMFYSDDQHLVFEDLLEESYEIQSPGRVSTEAELLTILDSLAAIHATGIAYEENHPTTNQKQTTNHLKSQLPDHFPGAFVEHYLNKNNPLCYAYLRAIIKSFATAIKVFNLPKTLKNGKDFEGELKRFEGLLDTIKPSKKYRNSVSHCDLWPANIFIKYDENNVPIGAKIIDHQIARYLPPAADVLDCIYLNTTREYRQENLPRIKRCYFDKFANYLKGYGVNPESIYTFDEFLASFDEIEMLPVFMAMATIPLVYNVDRSVAALMQSEDKHLIIFEDRSPLITNFLDNEYLMGRIKGAILDVMDSLEAH